MTITITGSDLTIDDVVRIARYGEKIEVHPEALVRMQACRDMLDRKLAEGQAIYGVNTGIGELADVKLEKDEVWHTRRDRVPAVTAGIATRSFAGSRSSVGSWSARGRFSCVSAGPSSSQAGSSASDATTLYSPSATGKYVSKVGGYRSGRATTSGAVRVLDLKRGTFRGWS